MNDVAAAPDWNPTMMDSMEASVQGYKMVSESGRSLRSGNQPTSSQPTRRERSEEKREGHALGTGQVSDLRSFQVEGVEEGAP